LTTVTKIDDLLENFVGIRDSELSTTVYDLAKKATSDDVFAGSLDEQLTDFEFPDDFVLDVSVACLWCEHGSLMARALGLRARARQIDFAVCETELTEVFCF